MNRRKFLGKTLATTTLAFSVLNSQAEEPAAPASFKRKIKLGIVGLGGRGQWIAGPFQKHGGYHISAVADYFPAVAKPVTVDVPGALAIQEAAKAATQRQRVFLVDYQIPTGPINIAVAQRIRDGGLGKLAQIQTVGMCGGFGEPPKTANLESRLQNLIWVNDVALDGVLTCVLGREAAGRKIFFDNGRIAQGE